jgi:hypothetical protein
MLGHNIVVHGVQTKIFSRAGLSFIDPGENGSGLLWKNHETSHAQEEGE